MSLPDLVVNLHEIALDSGIPGLCVDSGLRGVLLSLCLFERSQNLIKSWCFGELLLVEERAMRGWHFSDLILDDRVHFSHCKVDAPCELVLVIDFQPPVEGLSDVRFQNFND